MSVLGVAVDRPNSHHDILPQLSAHISPTGRDTYAGPNTPLPGLVCTGDSVWPGIGVPAVAASGTLVANMMVSPLKQLKMLKNIDFGGIGVE